MTKKNKIIGNLSEEVHKDFNIFKANMVFKNSDETIRFLLDGYKLLSPEQIEYILNRGLNNTLNDGETI